MPDAPRLVLASGSPRRQELLAALGLRFETMTPGVDETTSELDAVRIAEGLALRKARAIAERASVRGRVVIGADTVVVDGLQVLGKPSDDREARGMLERLRAGPHAVVSAVAVISGDRVAADHARTRVRMRDYSDEEVERYVASGEPLDKAGAYAIQDDDFRPVESVDGCVCSVIGLPLWLTRRLIRVTSGIEAARPAFLRSCAVCPQAEPQRSAR